MYVHIYDDHEPYTILWNVTWLLIDSLPYYSEEKIDKQVIV